jgi:mRNA interferase RelE/StbE
VELDDGILDGISFDQDLRAVVGEEGLLLVVADLVDVHPDYGKIVTALKDLATDLRPFGYKKLKGRPGYRIRVGDYRIIYQVKDNILTVFVLIIGNRRDVYD